MKQSVVVFLLLIYRPSCVYLSVFYTIENSWFSKSCHTSMVLQWPTVDKTNKWLSVQIFGNHFKGQKDIFNPEASQ